MVLHYIEVENFTMKLHKSFMMFNVVYLFFIDRFFNITIAVSYFMSHDYIME